MADKYLIGESLRDRLRTTIAKVEGMAIGDGATRIPTVHSQAPSYVPKTFRICEFTGTWAINTDKEVTFKGVTSTPNTVSVTNLVCGLNPSGSCDVSIAKDGTAWYLVQPNLTQLPGYSAGGTQVMVISGGNLQFMGTTACA